MFELNLPKGNFQIKNGEMSSIFDPLRRRYVRLTDEEWVRQHFVHYLISEKEFPPGRMANEVSIRLNNRPFRCDSVIYDSEGNPLVIVEYKSPNISITQKHFDQIVRYNMALKTPYLMLSNGLSHYCLRIDYQKMSVSFLNAIPLFSELR